MEDFLSIKRAAIAAIDYLLADRSVTSVQRERLQLVVERLELAHQVTADFARKLADAQQEVSRLTHELEHCKEQLARHRTAPEFHQHRGALWRNANGAWEPVVYCPTCKVSTAAWPNDFEVFSCGQCNWLSSFRGTELQRVISELPRS